MRYAAYILMWSLAAVACACSTSRPTPKATTANQAIFSQDEVRAKALRDAEAAISSGHLYICEAGTIGIYAPGVGVQDRALVQDLPRRMLLSGCTDPRALRSTAYAEVFNSEIIKYMSAHKK